MMRAGATAGAMVVHGAGELSERVIIGD